MAYFFFISIASFTVVQICQIKMYLELHENDSSFTHVILKVKQLFIVQKF